MHLVSGERKKLKEKEKRIRNIGEIPETLKLYSELFDAG